MAHVGEWRGDTGTREFERELTSHFKLVARVALPNFGNTACVLQLLLRDSVVFAPTAPSAYVVCVCVCVCGLCVFVSTMTCAMFVSMSTSMSMPMSMTIPACLPPSVHHQVQPHSVGT